MIDVYFFVLFVAISLFLLILDALIQSIREEKKERRDRYWKRSRGLSVK